MTIAEILALSPKERRQQYAVSGGARKDANGKNIDIGRVWIKPSKTTRSFIDYIDDFSSYDEFYGYGIYSFVWQLTLKESPSRVDDGSLPQLPDIPSFITAHLKIDFDLLSIDDYRRIMKLLYGNKNHCFKVKAYDIVYDRMVIVEMYFQPEDLPTIYTISENLQQGGDNVIDLVGVRSHTVEMVGTGNDNAQQRYFG